jgi:signal peptidase I
MSRSSGQSSESSDDRKQSGGGSLLELIVVVAVAIGAALLIQAFLVKPYRIPSESMLPTLEVGQRILVNRVEGRFGEPERGDIVVFMPPGGTDEPECGVTSGQHFGNGQIYRDGDEANPEAKMPCPLPAPGKFDEAYVKRVVGLPGDTISVRRGRAWINGKQLSEPYLPGTDDCRNNDDIATDCNFPTPVTVPAGHYFMMGDNRNDGASYDSRFWGPIVASSVVGEVFFTYWPPTKFGTP